MLSAGASEKLDRTYLRFFGWLAIASVIAALAAPNFLALLNQSVNEAFGSVLPAIPFATLLSVLFILRWRDLRGVLLQESGPTSEVPTRLLGIGIVASLLLLRGFTGLSVYSAGVAVIFAFFGTSLILNPLTRRIMLPYAAIYSVGVTAPAILQWGFGEPLAVLSSNFSAGIIALIGIPVAWHGTQFALVSRTGGLVAATITPGCSSIISVTTFLGLLGLMHIDLKKDLSSTVKLAVAGVAALTVLNSVRIAILVWVGYADGPAALWSVHNWVGYAIFLGFYLATLAIYPNMGGRTTYRNPTLKGLTPTRIG